MKYCVPQELINDIKDIFTRTMSSVNRLAILQSRIGADAAKELNMKFESAGVSKYHEAAIERFLKGLEITPAKRAELSKIIKDRLAAKNKAIDDNELISLAKHVLDKKYDLVIPEGEMKNIFKLKKEITALEGPAVGTLDGSKEKLAWGQKIIELADKINGLKAPEEGIIKGLRRGFRRIEEAYTAPKGIIGKAFGGTGQLLAEAAELFFDPAIKSIKASLDNSVLFRQGLKVLTADKAIWGKYAKMTGQVWARVFNKDKMTAMNNAFRADLVTRDLYQDAIKAKLAVGVVEDYFPTHTVDRIPGLGNFFKASSEAFTMFSQGSRMDLFEKYVTLIKKTDGQITPKQMEDIARVVNSITGRGGLGNLEAFAGGMNKILFSARYQTANINTIKHAFDPNLSSEVKAIAQRNLAVHFTAIAGVMTTLSAFTDVGFNPKESTFGKMRIPGTKKWVDVTGGLASYFSLIGRMRGRYTKPQFKDTPLDILLDFMKGKFAPAPGIIRDFLEQRDYSGVKPTTVSSLRSLFVPITAENVWKSYEKKEEIDTAVYAFIFEFIGQSVTQPKAKREGTYSSPLDIILGR